MFRIQVCYDLKYPRDRGNRQAFVYSSAVICTLFLASILLIQVLKLTQADSNGLGPFLGNNRAR